MKKLVICLVFSIFAVSVSFAQDKNSTMTDVIQRNDAQINEALDARIQALSEQRARATAKPFTVRTVVIESLQGPYTQVFTDTRQKSREAAFVTPEEAGQPVAGTQPRARETGK